MQMGMSMKGSGKMIRPTVMEATNTLMEQRMWATGKMINNTEKESKHGQMEQSMKVNTMKGRSMEEEL